MSVSHWANQKFTNCAKRRRKSWIRKRTCSPWTCRWWSAETYTASSTTWSSSSTLGASCLKPTSSSWATRSTGVNIPWNVSNSCSASNAGSAADSPFSGATTRAGRSLKSMASMMSVFANTATPPSGNYLLTFSTSSLLQHSWKAASSVSTGVSARTSIRSMSYASWTARLRCPTTDPCVICYGATPRTNLAGASVRAGQARSLGWTSARSRTGRMGSPSSRAHTNWSWRGRCGPTRSRWSPSLVPPTSANAVVTRPPLWRWTKTWLRTSSSSTQPREEGKPSWLKGRLINSCEDVN